MIEPVPKAYLLIYGDDLGTREQIVDLLNGIPEVEFWRYDLPNTFYVLSKYSAALLAEKLLVASGHKTARFAFFVVDPTNAQGRLTPESWYLLNTRQPAPDPSASDVLQRFIREAASRKKPATFGLASFLEETPQEKKK